MARLRADIHEAAEPAKVNVQDAEGPWWESSNRRRLVDGQRSLRLGSALCLLHEKCSRLSEAGAQPRRAVLLVLVKGESNGVRT